MRELIEQARKEKKWLWAQYHDLWWSPDQLEADQASGRFNWSPANFQLRDPQEKLNQIKAKIDTLTEEYNKVKKLIG